ncbi:replication protein P [Pseudomonas neustonica]|uniref:replication protein P n=1 Tax=Pseudomonas neustonica TaxID=2487346 RepID=UPI003F462E1F
MRPADEIARRVAEQGALPTLPENRQQVRLSQHDLDLVNRLFADLKAICPAWRREWPDAAAMAIAKQQWTKTLVESGVSSVEQVEHGKRVCRARTGREAAFVPSPGEFAGWCWPEPQELGLPPLEEAYREALRNSHPASIGHERWSHKAVYHATLACSRHSLMTLPGDTSRLKFTKHYRAVQKQLLNGVVLADPPPANQKALPRLGDPAKARSALAAMRASLGGAAQ